MINLEELTVTQHIHLAKKYMEIIERLEKLSLDFDLYPDGLGLQYGVDQLALELLEDINP